MSAHLRPRTSRRTGPGLAPSAFRMRAAALVTDGILAHRPAGDGIG